MESYRIKKKKCIAKMYIIFATSDIKHVLFILKYFLCIFFFFKIWKIHLWSIFRAWNHRQLDNKTEKNVFISTSLSHFVWKFGAIRYKKKRYMKLTDLSFLVFCYNLIRKLLCVDIKWPKYLLAMVFNFLFLKKGLGYN